MQYSTATNTDVCLEPTVLRPSAKTTGGHNMPKYHSLGLRRPLDPVVDRVECTDRLGCFVDRLDRLHRLVDDFTTRLDLDDFRST